MHLAGDELVGRSEPYVCPQPTPDQLLLHYFSITAAARVRRDRRPVRPPGRGQRTAEDRGPKGRRAFSGKWRSAGLASQQEIHAHGEAISLGTDQRSDLYLHL